ncbi:hypothetical protein CSQ89_02950 [Chitinimonas sp. BJB300]|nr:hypothetical protein CSQ89_02950 [Chitinimonas sp. BJB300]TSJ89169.1 hypothetical protein FG002_009510 [Chitinimonas sp. BJB300]
MRLRSAVPADAEAFARIAADRWLAVLRIELGVFVDKKAAYRLYQKFGFEEEGIQRGFAFRDGCYQDVRLMARLNPCLLQQ